MTPMRFGWRPHFSALARIYRMARCTSCIITDACTAGTEAILQHESGDALLIQPERILETFMRRQIGIPAADR